MNRLLVLLCLLLASPTWAAVTPGTTYNGSGTTGTSATIGSVSCPGPNAALFIATGGASGDQPTGVTFGAANAVSVASATHGGTSISQLWRVLAPSGTDTITATWAAAQTNGAAVSAICLSVVHQTTPTGTPATGNAASTTVSGQSVSGSASDDLVLDVVSWGASGATLTPDSGTTERTTLNPYGGWALNIGTHASGTSQSPTWTLSTSQDWTQIVVNVAASGGSGPTTQFFRRRVQ